MRLNGGPRTRISRAICSTSPSFVHEAGEVDEAKAFVRRAVAIDEEFFGSEYPRIAISLATLAQQLREKEDMVESERLFVKSLAILAAMNGETQPETPDTMVNLARLLSDTNRHQEAEGPVRKALAVTEAGWGRLHPSASKVLAALADLLLALCRGSEAETTFPTIEAYCVLVGTDTSQEEVAIVSGSCYSPLG